MCSYQIKTAVSKIIRALDSNSDLPDNPETESSDKHVPV
jgi:hypothetical protein